MLRQALGTLLATAPEKICLVEQRGAAPQLNFPAGAHVGFSISHSGAWVACAVSDQSMLGLDIEVLDPRRDLDALAQQAFAPADIAWLRARQEATRVRDFYDLWCASEARIKLHAHEAQCVHLAHDALSIALCSAQVLPHMPLLQLRSLADA